MKTSDKIMQTIKRCGVMTAKQLADELGMTTMGARQHLQGLEESGLLSFDDVRAKVGRPTRHWSLTAKGHAQFSDRHGELTVQLIDAVESLYGAQGLADIQRARETRLFEQYHDALSHASSLLGKLQILVSLREREGYMAQLETFDDGYLLIENHCPICKAAIHSPALCQTELTLFQRLLATEAQVTRREHIIAGQRRCAYWVEAQKIKD
ncbi:transcriptional regulator [Vibrio sp. SM6]|uniref:Transcriptional regulator n=1 Tax=Vibrio agarilyticus TaxID=2726741 RepID=A0A7X8YHH7_9VIBR|nr:metalloregulator ArsR/SmtB family transcription factor [Vibrio agarilyticus]NLS13511.1 transcriptional regulator [Vibrio agarilyticus]